jgi:phosphatidate cytidylyltransferase
VTAPAGSGAPGAVGSLTRRALAALVLMPVVLGALWLGNPVWTILIAIAAGAMGWEWRRLTSRGSMGAIGWAMVALVAVVVLLPLSGRLDLALWLLAGGTLLLGLAAGMREGASHAGWLAAGILYVALPALSLAWLRDIPEAGLATLLWLLILVWAIDTAAYAAGKLIGGPKLIPRISPNKTWAGLAGGALGALVVGYVAARWIGQTSPWPLACLSFLLAFIEQAGDAFESAVKRHFGVKDSSGLIPGHGGMLDRVDGLVAVALAVAGFVLVTGVAPLASDWP